MEDSSLPFEVLENIIRDLISQYTGTRRRSEPTKLIPRWYLVPLLRVCKLWHKVAERFLYRSISVGDRFPGARARQAYKIPRRLLTTLASSSRLAALVEELQMGVQDVAHRKSVDWTQRNIRILRLCPNVKHVEIYGFHFSLQDSLTDVLKDRSLVSFRMTTRFLSSYEWHEEERSLKLSELMMKWPNLHSIYIEGFKIITDSSEACGIETPDLTFYLPELQQVVVLGSFDRGNIEFLRFLRSISGNVKRLGIYKPTRVDNEAELQTLCGCLCAWSGTLEYLRLDNRSDGKLCWLPLWKVLSSLKELRELQLFGEWPDFGSIATLPHLERLAIDQLILKEHKSALERHLEDDDKFPALQLIAEQYLGLARFSIRTKWSRYTRDMEADEEMLWGLKLSTSYYLGA